MSVHLEMSIADLHFNLKCEAPVMLEDLPESYKQFLEKDHTSNGKTVIDIAINLDNIPETGSLSKIFETSQSWSMFRDGEEYILALNPPVLKDKPLYAARFRHDPDKLTIYCSEMMIKRINSRITLFNPFCYPLDQLLLMYILSNKEGALFHAAGLNLNGKGYIFPGRSGAGKSTLSRQFSEAKNSVMLSDDRVIVRKTGDSFRLFGTPWPGEEGIAENKNTELKGIFFISHATENKAEDIKPVEALRKLMPVASIPWFDRDVLPKLLDFFENLVSNVPAYQLYFRPDKGVVEFLEKFSSK